MLTPQPESDLTLNELVLGASIIRFIKDSKGYLIGEDLLEKFLTEDIRRTPSMFFETLVILYSTGILKEDRYKIFLKKNETQKTLF